MVRIIETDSDFDLTAAMRVNQEIHKIQEEYKGPILLDMSKVTKINSTGIGLLVHTWKTLDNTKNDLIIYQPSETVAQVLSDTSLHRIFKIVHNLDKYQEI